MRLKFSLLLLFALLTGCTRQSASAPPLCTVVTKITVTFDNGPFHVIRHYTDAEKTRAILTYIRQIDPYGKPEEDPLTVSGSDYRIELHCSDGSIQHYRQKGERLLQDADGIWKKIDPKKAQRLALLIGSNHSDPF